MKAIKNGMWKADYTGLPTSAVAASWFTSVKTEKVTSA